MKRINNNQSHQTNKTGETMITSNHEYKITTNILCDMLTVKLNHNITRNLPIDVIREIVSYTYRYQQKVQQKRRFQFVLRDIENGTMCVLRTLTVYEIFDPENPLDVNYRRLDRWRYWMYPYITDYGYEGASRYITQLDIIYTSKQLLKQHKRCKYQTINDIAAHTEREYNNLDEEYDINNNEGDVFDQAQSFDYFFLRK